MSEEVKIIVRPDGPYRVEGPVVIEDVDGNRFPLPEGRVALCRCGGSSNKPFCDGSHRQMDFQADTRARPPQ